MAENADNDSVNPSRVARRAPSKRRASSASGDIESTLVREMQPAQAGEPARDDSTLDLFAGDPLYARVQTVDVDDGQGMLGGFEPLEQRRLVVEAGQVTGMVGVARDVVGETAVAVVPVTDGVQAPVLAEVDGADTTPAHVTTTEPILPGQALAQLRAGRGSAVPQPAKGGRAASRAAAAADSVAATAPLAAKAQPPEPTNASPASDRLTPESRSTGDVARATAAVVDSAVADASAPPTTRQAPPSLEQAGVAPFAPAIDALQSEIADQRRAVADLSRRMKWMPAAVVGALLVTVATGIAQTIVLSRLAADASAQQQRVTQMMQDQQTAIADVLAHLASAAAVPPAQAATPPQPPARPAATTPAHHTQHASAHGHHTRRTGQ